MRLIGFIDYVEGDTRPVCLFEDESKQLFVYYTHYGELYEHSLDILITHFQGTKNLRLFPMQESCQADIDSMNVDIPIT